MCNACYEYNRRFGTTDRPEVRQKEPESVKFWRRVNVTDDCWLWTGRLNGKGYGSFKMNSGVNTMAHRASWIMADRTIPDGYQLDHLCLVKNCVNPDHLEPVTGHENMDRWAKSVTKCKNGHPKQGRGRCQVCVKERFERFYEKHGGRSAYDDKRRQSA